MSFCVSSSLCKISRGLPTMQNGKKKKLTPKKKTATLSFHIKHKQPHISSSRVVSPYSVLWCIQVKPTMLKKVARAKKKAGALPVCCIWNGSLQQHCCSNEPQLFEPGMPWRQLVARQPSTTGVLHFPLLVAFRSSSVSCYSTCMLTVGAIESTSHKNCLCWVGSHGAAGV